MYSTQQSQVMAAHVSFGSHPQKVPQASRAQSAPNNMPKVRKASPTYTRLSVIAISWSVSFPRRKKSR